MNKKIIGAWGENIAKQYLQNKGYSILEANWRHHHLELDLIAYKDAVIGFEIKTRKRNTDLAFTILKSKQVTRLRIALKAYCFLRGLDYNLSRLDLIVINIKNKNTITIRHYLDI